MAVVEIRRMHARIEYGKGVSVVCYFFLPDSFRESALNVSRDEIRGKLIECVRTRK